MKMTSDSRVIPIQNEGGFDINFARLSVPTEFVGTSRKFLLALDQIRRFADLNESVLI